MEPLGISVVRADESYGYAKYYYYDGPTVYIEITAINSRANKWRVKGRKSLGDNVTYIEQEGVGLFSFSSENNKSYIFQIQNWNGDWVNTTNAYGETEENSIINVVFESDGDGGDEGGGDPWEPGDDSDLTPRHLHVNQGEGTIVKVRRNYPEYRKVHDSLEPDDPIYCDGVDEFYILTEAEDGYELDYYEFAGLQVPYILENFIYARTIVDEYGNDRHLYRLHYDMDASVTTTAHIVPGAPISSQYAYIMTDDEDAYGPDRYRCYICTEYVSGYTGFIDGSCEVVGADYCLGTSTSADDMTQDFSGYTTGPVFWGANNSTNVLYSLKFVTPDYLGESGGLTFSIKMMSKLPADADDSNKLMNYAICTSDENHSRYVTTTQLPTDECRIAYGTFSENPDGFSVITDDTVKLLPNTEYYLFVWDTNQDGALTSVASTQYHTITIATPDPSSDPVYSVGYRPFSIYIDNGTSFVPVTDNWG